MRSVWTIVALWQCVAASQSVESILKSMSLQQKIGQLTQFDISMLTDGASTTLDENKLHLAFNASFGNLIGSVINTPFSGCDCNPSDPCTEGLTPSAFAKLVQEIEAFNAQQQASAGLQHIPVLYGLDSVHGANYVTGAPIFPHNTGVAASFDVGAARTVGQSAATWTRSAGIPWMFSPVLGLGMQPLWSRLYETFGEDPVVGATMGGSFVLGAQNDSTSLLGLPSDTAAIAATAKHYFGYSNPQDGKDRTDAWIPDIYLKQYFEPAFQAAFDAGVLTTMINSASVNGVPAHANKMLLSTILRDQIGFQGVAVTDWQDIEKLVFYHRIAGNISQAVQMAFDAGVDMSMVPSDYTFGPTLQALVESGAISEERVDASVARVLALKQTLGLLNNTQVAPDAALRASERVTGVPVAIRGAALARDSDGGAMNVTRASLTLLKNNNTNAATQGKPVLPLTNWLVKESAVSARAGVRGSSSGSGSGVNILVTGPSSTTRTALCGGWTQHWLGACESAFTRGASIADGVKQVAASYGPFTGLGSGVSVTSVQGVNFSDWTQAGLDAAAAAAKAADVVVLAVGEAPESESEGIDNTLELSDSQKRLFEAVAAAGKPVVTVLVEPRPRILGDVALGSEGLVMAYLPCYSGGVAIAELLFGELNPSGRLPITYPQFSGDITPYYRKPTGDYSQGTSKSFHSPLYPFGFGLGYSQIEESTPQLSTDRLAAGQTLGVRVTVTNHGPMDAWHAVLVFVRQLWRGYPVTPEVKLLKAYQRVFVPAGGSQDVSLEVQYKDLSFVTPAMETRVEAAPYEVLIGDGVKHMAAFNVTQTTSYGFSQRYV